MAQDSGLATRPGNGLFGLELELALAAICFCLFVPKEAKEIIIWNNCTAPLHGPCCLRRWDFSSGWQLRINPLCKSSFLLETRYWNTLLFWSYPLSHLQKKRTFWSPVHLRCSFIWFEARARMCLCKHTRTARHTCMYANSTHTLLQPKLCCPFILQVMTKINCELHSICTEFTVQMNSNEENIEIQQLWSILGLCVFVLFRYFLSNVTEAISRILVSQ